MDTLALVLRYGFLVALLVEAVLIGRALFAMLREKAVAQRPSPSNVEASAAVEE